MRPHVEFVDEKDLIWHMAELPHGSGDAEQQNLSYDEEDGSASLRVRFNSAWSRPAGLHTAFTEWYILKGEVQLGDQTLIEGDYWCAPKGILTPAISATAGTIVLLFREYGDWKFTPGDSNGPEARDIDELTVVSTSQMEWYDVTHPEHGSPMDFESGGTPVPGLFIKMLYHDTETDFYTRLIKAKPGWREHPLAHHPVSEEAYCLEGLFDYNYGVMSPGQYFFRPKGIRHGDFTAGEDDGCTWILRCDGRLVDWYTDNASVEMKGDATNWGEGFPGTEPPEFIMPVRSKTVGAWKDPTYQ
jgi:quercetin dioxygenase-like cupin family protein